MIFEKVLWIIITAFVGGVVGLIFWRYKRHKEQNEKKEKLRVTFYVCWTGKKSEFVIGVKVINTGLVPIIIKELLYTIKRSGKYARTIKEPSFRDPFDTLEFFKRNPFQYLKHRLIKMFGFNDHYVYLQFSNSERILQRYGDEWAGKIEGYDHTIHNSNKIKVSVSVVTSTDSKFKGIRND